MPHLFLRNVLFNCKRNPAAATVNNLGPLHDMYAMLCATTINLVVGTVI